MEQVIPEQAVLEQPTAARPRRTRPRLKVLSNFGTRPEAIKIAPVVRALQAMPGVHAQLFLTSQHREMLDQVTALFGLSPDADLDVMLASQGLTHVTTAVLIGLERVLRRFRPDCVLVHGDTTTAMAASLAAFYGRIPVSHVEAGVRSGDVQVVYPVHLNPKVQVAARRVPGETPGVHLTGPLGCRTFTWLMARAHPIITDSGGIQEEAPALGKPVLVTRETTERHEAGEAGTIRLVGATAARIVGEAERLLDDPADCAAMAQRVNPYGDGKAATRICARLMQEFA